MTTTFPIPRTGPFDPPADYAELREGPPAVRAVLPTGKTTWLITRYDLVRRILVDPRVSSDRLHPNFPLPVAIPPEAKLRTRAFGRALIGADPPEHTARRRMVISEFTIRKIRAMRPRIQQIVDDRIDAMLAGQRPADLVAELALPVPSLVICELLGVPYTDREFFQERTKLLINRSTPPDVRMRASEELTDYFDELVTGKERDPGDDLLGRLIRNNEETQVFDHDLLTGMAFLLLVAGHETTANMISLGTIALLEHPGELDRLRANPELIGSAVDELLRYLTIVEAGFRVAKEDIDVDGVLIKAGEGLVALAGGANRDDTVFSGADELDLARTNTHHVAFGYGIHQCLGQNLARLELELVFTTLFRRIPGLRLAKPVDELPYKEDATIYGVYELPVTW